MGDIEPITAREFHATEGVEDWHVISDGASVYVPTGSLTAGARLVGAIAALDGIDEHAPDIDLRPDGVTIRLLTYRDDFYGMTRQDVDVARRISDVIRALGLTPDATKVQSVLVVPGAPDPARVMPFWEAAFGYARRRDSPDEDLVDPRNRWPAQWFETMQEPRGGDGGGAIHLAVFVPVGQAQARVEAALAAGGHVVRSGQAPAWWTLADEAGNEVDISTLEGRD